METMSTEINIFNEDGILSQDEIKVFCNKIENQSSINFDVLNGESDTTIFKTLKSKDLEFTVFNHGYVMYIEGDIKESIILLGEIDKALMRSNKFTLVLFKELRVMKNVNLQEVLI